jgi:DNA-3-methyladenine glycosylase I
VIRYHDHEWGVPARDDRKHFEFLVLEGAQTGLNWLVILNKREGYRRAFSDFDPEKVARYSDKRVAKLLQNPDIIRNRMKIESAISNARAFFKIQEEFGTFWAYARWPPKTKPVEKRRRHFRDHAGIRRVQQGSQGAGIFVCWFHGGLCPHASDRHVNDHAVDCFRYPEILRNDTLAT